MYPSPGRMDKKQVLSSTTRQVKASGILKKTTQVRENWNFLLQGWYWLASEEKAREFYNWWANVEL